MFSQWFKLASDTTLLALEAQIVIGTRVAQLATGQGSLAENRRMVTEKFTALVQASATVMAGGSPQVVVSGYRKAVRKNIRRLKASGR